jgi:oligopeptide transport system substrate-binding protein
LKKLSKTSRGVLVVVAVLVALSLVLVACGDDGTNDTGGTAAGTPKPGGTYNYSLGAEPVNIEPLNAQESEGIQVAHQCFWGLVRYEEQSDGSIEVKPAVAETWEANADASEWTFHLRKDATFAPPANRTITAKDFIYSWNRATDPANQSVVSYILSPIVGADDSGYAAKGLTGISAPDDYTLVVKLRYSFAEFPMTLGHTVAAPVPQEIVEKEGNKKFGDKPVGNGPFMVQEWNHNKSITLVKNPNFWDKPNAGYVDTINMPIFSSENTMWLEFQKGTVDYTEVPSGQVQASMNMSQVKDGTWTAKKYPNLGVYFVGMNMKEPALGGSDNLPLRQALYYATNSQAIINVVNEGVGLPGTGYVPVGISGYVPNQSPYGYDVDKSKELIGQLGTVPTLGYWYNTESEGNQKIGEAVQADWADVGVKLELSGFEWGTFLSKLQEGKQQAFRMGWLADYPSMDNFLYPLFQSDQARTGSYTFYNNPDFDAKIQTARETVDETQRHQLYAEAEKMALTDIPAIPLYFYQDYRVTNNRVAGYNHNSMGFTDMWKVWVAQ